MSTSSSTKRCWQFSLKEIKAVTNQFDSNNFLGKGGEAMVYSADIYIGTTKTPVAVKHLNAPKNKRDNTKEFESEIHILSKIQHPNIVSLIGYCNESGQKILVYEYMANGSLSDYLKKKKNKSLSWLQRLNICLDVARGLQHLHSETDEFGKGIIHRDVKPGNILVGENWVGKLSDFGMFKLSNAGQDISSMITVRKGTAGYYAPEYHKLGRVTRKIDVYAFGVVLFQVLCEKMPWDREDENYFYDENEDIGIWALKNYDSQIRREMSEDCLTLFADIIGRTLQGNPGKRPTMANVVLDLEKVLLECQDSEYQPNQLDDTKETYLQASPSKQPTINDVVLNLQKVLECKKSENRPKQHEGSLRICRQFSIKEIEACTNNFDSSKIIGRGGHSTVYLAGIYIGSNKTLVAVKELKYNSKELKYNSKEFEREIHTLSKIQHPNIVSLIGYCNESSHKILVYEYIAKGCLSDYLRKGSRISFSWLERLNVCLGAARGLQHLHTETDEFPNGIIHRDVKPHNILIGENWVAKLCDFEMFKLSVAGQDNSTNTIVTALKGTGGYFAPEYIMLHRVTRKIDVYAFGVVLFEVLCRKMPWDREEEEYYRMEDEDLGIWAQENVDAQIREEISGESLTLFTDIIGRSLQANPGKRPSMNDVVLDIQKAIECQEYENLAKQLEDKDVEKEYELTLANQNEEEVKGKDDKPTCQICKRRNHEAIDCSYRFDRSYQS